MKCDCLESVIGPYNKLINISVMLIRINYVLLVTCIHGQFSIPVYTILLFDLHLEKIIFTLLRLNLH
jgi:phage shock protein PspC (stress-responsive transcriptional regulator)